MEPIWDREEVVVLVENYFRTKNQERDKYEEGIRKLSEFLRHRQEAITRVPVSDTFRNYAGVYMQTSRVKCLDPATDLCGMQGTKLQKAIVQEYLQNQESIIDEARNVYKKYSDSEQFVPLNFEDDNQIECKYDCESDAGWKLSSGSLESAKSDNQNIWEPIIKLCSDKSRLSSSYKFVFLLAILDSLNQIGSDNKLSFDCVFKEFTREYWVLVGKYGIKQSRRITHIESIISNYIIKYGYVPFSDTAEMQQLLLSVKRKCRTYVIGALYIDFNRMLYGFSKREEAIYFSDFTAKFLKENEITVRNMLIEAWIAYMSGIKANNLSYERYKRIINASRNIENKDSSDRSTDKKKKTVKKLTLRQKQEYKILSVIKKYNEVGLYETQIADLSKIDKDIVHEILKESSKVYSKYRRFYLVESKKEDVLIDILAGIDLDDEQEESNHHFVSSNESLVQYFDDPEIIIKELKKKKNLK